MSCKIGQKAITASRSHTFSWSQSVAVWALCLHCLGSPLEIAFDPLTCSGAMDEDKGFKMIHIAESEQVVWDAYLISALPHAMGELPQRAPEQIAERAAEIADEMLVERRERRPQFHKKVSV